MRKGLRKAGDVDPNITDLLNIMTPFFLGKINKLLLS